MHNNLNISVCMTVFAQSKYLKEQLSSILSQTKKIDELVILEDFSGKNSPRDYIEKFCLKENVKLLYEKCKINIGPAECFRKAISMSNGDVIFLSDHDDIWHQDRVREAMLFHNHNDLVVVNGHKFKTNSDATLVSSNKNNKIYQNIKLNIFKLILSNQIIGATISLKGNIARLLASKINFYPMHDWILVISFLVLNKKIKYIDQDLISYRRHEETFTGNKKNNFLNKIKFRFVILYTILRVFMLK